jgi:hypothetical protein
MRSPSSERLHGPIHSSQTLGSFGKNTADLTRELQCVPKLLQVKLAVAAAMRQENAALPRLAGILAEKRLQLIP